jgi:glycine/D-amino acid oxidase-like deaminating enzyme
MKNILENPEETTTSLWDTNTKPFTFTRLNKDIDTEVLIIGGGIAGVTTAYNLLKAGKKVVLIDESSLGSGETGNSTAHLTACLDVRYFKLEERLGEVKARQIANSHVSAIEWIEKTILSEKINCNLKRINGYLYSENHEMIEREFKSTRTIGLETELLESTPVIYSLSNPSCISFPQQAQLHALNYLKGLIKAIEEMGGEIYSHTKVDQVNDNQALANGYTVRANHIVITTNMPLNNKTLEWKQTSYRSYAIAARVPKGNIPYALWWEIEDVPSDNEHQSYYYARLEKYDDLNDVLIIGGEDEEGEEDSYKEEEKYQKLLEWGKTRFKNIQKVEYKWSGLIRYSNDGLAFIGKTGQNNTYIITGDSGNGITYATIGSLIITDAICGRKNAWEDLYTPQRNE